MDLSFYYFQVEKMIEYVKKAFKIYLLHKTWMDEETKRHAEEKVYKIYNIYHTLLIFFII